LPSQGWLPLSEGQFKVENDNIKSFLFFCIPQLRTMSGIRILSAILDPKKRKKTERSRCSSSHILPWSERTEVEGVVAVGTGSLPIVKKRQKCEEI
jgi:hypothetical protein